MRNLKTKKHLQQIQLYFYLCETLKKQKTETNADFPLIMRNPDDHKTTATNADLLLIMLNPEDQKTTATNADLLLILRNRKTKKRLQQLQTCF